MSDLLKKRQMSQIGRVLNFKGVESCFAKALGIKKGYCPGRVAATPAIFGNANSSSSPGGHHCWSDQGSEMFKGCSRHDFFMQRINNFPYQSWIHGDWIPCIRWYLFATGSITANEF